MHQVHLQQGPDHDRHRQHRLVQDRARCPPRPYHAHQRAVQAEQALQPRVRPDHRPQCLQEAEQGLPRLGLLLPPGVVLPLQQRQPADKQLLALNNT